MDHDSGRFPKPAKIEGTVVLEKMTGTDYKAFVDSVIKNVSLKFITDHDGNVEDVHWELKDKSTTCPRPLIAKSTIKVTFKWNEQMRNLGALLIKNNLDTKFYLKSLTLEDVPYQGRIHFVCNSWVYPADKYEKDRVFFSNKAYLPSKTPKSLKKYRNEELENLRGDAKRDGKGDEKGDQLQEWDRVYDYAYYNDLGNPDQHHTYARPVLGGSEKYPYPQSKSESRLNLLMGLNIYVPSDERFGLLKMSDFLSNGLKSIAQFLKPELESIFGIAPSEFDSFEGVLNLYGGTFSVPAGLLENIRDNFPVDPHMFNGIFPTDGEGFLKYPMPQVIKEDKSAWRTDEEFAREMLAGVNPVNIRRLEEFPPKSKLDPEIYVNQDSKITKEHIENNDINMDGLSVEEAIKKEKLFILDHHDAFMPYLSRINSTTSTKTYASRTILFLKNDGTLKPLAIELSLPDPDVDKLGSISKVYTPAEQGVESNIWQLAKAYVAVNDSGYHQLISHWLNTHAVIEPFVIATNRQLSVLHPIHKLLHPHFRDTMYINAFARHILLNAGGLLESTVFPGKYSMEMSSEVYKKWKFTEQALPKDLINRGMAVPVKLVKDSDSPGPDGDSDSPGPHVHGLRLLIKDYPYAVDGLEIWSAIETWVTDYCNFYYKSDDMVEEDSELQSWWKELREEGHGDKKDGWGHGDKKDGWPKMEKRKELVETCTIIIWIASALHAAVNFGQYPYAGYLPNRPTISRRFMPEKDTPEYEELKSDPEKVFLKTITAQLQTLLGISLIETLSRHSSDEKYLGQRDTNEWTTDTEPLDAFEEFRKKLDDIEKGIIKRNSDETLKNRFGPVNVPYTLLCPTSEAGITGKGIPNSVSI